jgi:hypothetical protein
MREGAAGREIQGAARGIPLLYLLTVVLLYRFILSPRWNGSRMGVAVDVLQSLYAYVRVQLRSPQAGVAKEQLQAPQVCAIFHHERCRRVSEQVTTAGFRDTRFAHVTLPDQGQQATPDRGRCVAEIRPVGA